MLPSSSELETAAQLHRWTAERPMARKRARVIAKAFGRVNLTRDAREVIVEALLRAGVTTRPSLLECDREDWVQLIVAQNGDSPRVHWRFLAGPESLIGYETDKRCSVSAWTADRGGHALKGDLVALYATGRLQRYMAIARVCCRPVRNSKVRARIDDREWWTYLQVQPLACTVPRAQVEAQDLAQTERSGLRTPHGSGSNRVGDAVAGEAFDFLVDGDANATATLQRWRTGSGDWPKHLDLEELKLADWAPPERSASEEMRLSRQIAAHLVKTGKFRYLRAEDRVGADRGGDDPARLSLEHRIRDAAGTGSIDVLLVDLRHRTALLAIEVKLRATLAPHRNPVPQIVRYGAALKQRDGGSWSVGTLVVAEHFADAVIDEAERHEIDRRQCSPKRGHLSPPLG
jgi:hypothetical protein